MAKHKHLPGLVAATLNLPGFYDQDIGVDDLSKKGCQYARRKPRHVRIWTNILYNIIYIYIYPAINLLISPLDPQLKPQWFAQKVHSWSQFQCWRSVVPRPTATNFPENLTVFTGKTHISSVVVYPHSKQPNCNHQPTIMNLNSIDPHLMVKTL